MLKNVAKKFIVAISWFFVRRYQARFTPTIIAVAGSIGKTGTKRTISLVLSGGKRVAWQDGNYNDIVTVPLVYFGLSEPSLYNPFAWMIAFLRMAVQCMQRQGAQIVVLELGTDKKGDIASFNGRLFADYGVVTAIAAEHMQNFGTLDAVAEEEFMLAKYTKQLYIEGNILDNGFSKSLASYKSYGSSKNCDTSFVFDGTKISITSSKNIYEFVPMLQGRHQYGALTIAAELGEQVGLEAKTILKGLRAVAPMPGRMQILQGKDGSHLIDDTYNSSPEAAIAALDYLYERANFKKIAVLGSMNEMGDSSQSLHEKVAAHCDFSKIDVLITIGHDANKYIGEYLEKKSANVIKMNSPYQVGKYLSKLDLANTVVLFKGSQNGVFLEEAVKLVLQDPHDSRRLVRQSSDWNIKKNAQFGAEI